MVPCGVKLSVLRKLAMERLRARGLLMYAALFLSAYVLIESDLASADNKSDVSEIAQLYSKINQDIQNNRFSKVYIFTKFPSEQRFVQETYTEDVEYSPDRTVVYYRKGYVAKIENRLTGAIVVVN